MALRILFLHSRPSCIAEQIPGVYSSCVFRLVYQSHYHANPLQNI